MPHKMIQTWARLRTGRPERIKPDPEIPPKYIRLVDRALTLHEQMRSTSFYGQGADKARARLRRKARNARRKVLELIRSLTHDER